MKVSVFTQAGWDGAAIPFNSMAQTFIECLLTNACRVPGTVAGTQKTLNICLYGYFYFQALYLLTLGYKDGQEITFLLKTCQ